MDKGLLQASDSVALYGIVTVWSVGSGLHLPTHIDFWVLIHCF